MSGLRVSDGLLLGTYRPAKLYKYNGAMNELLSLPAESVYMLYMPPDGLPLFSTECPAQVYKMTATGQWERKFTRSEPESVAFEFHKITTGLSVFTVNRAWGESVRLISGDANGNTWNAGPDINGKRLINSVSDSRTKYLIGSVKDSSGQDFPIICDRNGNEIARRPEFDDQTANYALLDDSGNMSIGMNAVDMEDKYHGKYSKRNAYIDLYNVNSKVWRTIKDLTRPYIFDMVMDEATKYRYLVETSWNERDFNTSIVWRSTDRGVSWNQLFEVEMRTVNSIQIADGGVYLYGGQFGQYGKVCFYRF
jgi:hypothetical protein